MRIANNSRRLLIRFGKVQPFILCFIVCLVYTETLYSLLNKNFLYFCDCVIINTPISFTIANILEYDWLFIILSTIISLAIEVCKWNLYATAFLFFNLFEKSYFDFELEPTAIYIICIANIIVAGYLTLKGIKILLTSRKQ